MGFFLSLLFSLIFISFYPYSVWHAQILLTASVLLFLGYERQPFTKNIGTASFYLFIALIGAALCSVLFSLNIIGSITTLFSFLAIFFILLMVPEEKKPALMQGFIHAVLVLTVSSVVYVILKSVGGSHFEFIEYFNTPQNLLTPFFGHSFYTIFLVSLFPFVLEKTTGKNGKIFPWLVSALYGIGILFSFSRAALGICFLQFVVWILVRSNVHRRRSILLGLGLVVSVYVLFVVVFTAQNPWLQERIVKDSVSSRLEYWRQGVEAIRHSSFSRLLFGYGTDMFYDLSTNYQKNPFLVSRSAHNFYLQFFIEQGLVVSLIFALLVGSFLLRHTRHYSFGEKMSLLSILLFSLVGTVSLNLFAALLLFFMILTNPTADDKMLTKISPRRTKSSVALIICAVLVVWWGRYLLAYGYFVGLSGLNPKLLSVFPYEESFWTLMKEKYSENQQELKIINDTYRKYHHNSTSGVE